VRAREQRHVGPAAQQRRAGHVDAQRGHERAVAVLLRASLRRAGLLCAGRRGGDVRAAVLPQRHERARARGQLARHAPWAVASGARRRRVRGLGGHDLATERGPHAQRGSHLRR